MLLPFLLANDDVNDADEVNELLLVFDAILDGGITPANLADDFTLDAQTQLTNNSIEVHVQLNHVFSATLTTGYKAFHTLVAGAYTLIGAYQNYTMTNGTGAPGGSPNRVTYTVKAGAYVAGTFTVANTAISTQTIYAAQTESVSSDITGSIFTSSQTGPKTLALSVDQIPATNPPTSGILGVTLVLTRSLQ